MTQPIIQTPVPDCERHPMLIFRRGLLVKPQVLKGPMKLRKFFRSHGSKCWAVKMGTARNGELGHASKESIAADFPGSALIRFSTERRDKIPQKVSKCVQPRRPLFSRVAGQLGSSCGCWQPSFLALYNLGFPSRRKHRHPCEIL